MLGHKQGVGDISRKQIQLLFSHFLQIYVICCNTCWENAELSFTGNRITFSSIQCDSKECYFAQTVTAQNA